MHRLEPEHDLPAWAWLWFPPLMAIAVFTFRAFDHTLYRKIFNGELGVVELATPVLAFAATGYGIAILRKLQPPALWLRGWFLAVTLGAFYFGGEELSWGQHLAGWETPQYLEEINDQEETNLHNVSSWFDQKPRLLLELWVLIGGVIIAWRLRKPQDWPLDDWRPWFWPGRVCILTAVIAIAIKLPERVKDILDLPSLPLEIRYSEPQEYYFALFMLIYLASVWYRARPAGPKHGA